MRKVKLEMQVSIDGFSADANGSPDWMVWSWGEDWSWDNALRRYHIELTTSSDCLLLSRKMAEEGFHQHWAQVAENPHTPQFAFAKAITEMPKLVFSRTLKKSVWPNTELAKGDLTNELAALRRAQGKDILAYGGPTFASSLLEADLIDELHLFVNPTALGNGRSMFNDLGHRVNLKLIEATPYECGVAVLRYARQI